jgi:hypothetical protein
MKTPVPETKALELAEQLRSLGNWGSRKRYCINLFEKYSAAFITVYLLTVAVYSYFFSSLFFTNHIFPNAFVEGYPSYRTLGEGRWFADIIRFLVGGTGVQATQMIMAVALQIINGFLFAQLLRVTNRIYILLAAAFLALHPAFLDYYSFTSDHIAFVLGDSLALLGVLALDRVQKRYLAILFAALCFVLVFAIYQPKIALVAFLLLAWCVIGTHTGNTAKEKQPNSGMAIRHLSDRVIPALLAFVIGLLGYYLSIRLTISFDTSNRTHINDFGEMLQQVAQAYPSIIQRLGERADYLPRVLQYLPMLVVLLGVLSLVLAAWRTNYWLALTALALIAVMPIALQLSHIINANTWQSAGRILAPDAYFLLFFLVSAWKLPWPRFIPTMILVTFVYYFSVIGSQETNAAAFKNIFDVEKISRVVSQIENVTPELYRKQWPIVVIGHISPNNEDRFRRYKNDTYGAHIKSETFEAYRQVEILNFFLGRDIVIRPTQVQVDSALTSQRNRRAWPAPESVYLDNGTIVVILEKPDSGVPVTWVR